MRYRAYSIEDKRLSKPFELNDIAQAQFGVIVQQGCKPYDLNRCMVMRSSELVDINNNEVYESDIVSFPLYIPGTEGKDSVDLFHAVIIFKEGRFTFDRGEPKWSRMLLDQYSMIKGKAQVEGNIYQTPELIEDFDLDAIIDSLKS